MKILITAVILTCLLIPLERPAFSDTIFMKNDREVKGIVVEEYKDRIVLSTYEGEKTLFKRSIRSVVYDSPEKNLVRLGDSYVARREFGKAYYYYSKAYKLNPENKIGKEKMDYVTGLMFRKQEENKLRDVKRLQEFESWSIAKEEETVNYEDELERALGFRLTEKNGKIEVSDVKLKSAAYNAGVRTGDILVAVWGKFTGYMPAAEVARLLYEESFGEVKITIDREIKSSKKKKGLKYSDIIGGKLAMLFDGLTVVSQEGTSESFTGGLKKDDLIIEIDGLSMRYMPLDRAINLIEEPGAGDVVLTVRRDITVWRKQ